MRPYFYLVSLYYDKHRVTGANKRFDEIGKCLLESGQHNFLVFVTAGNEPSWCPRELVRSVRPYHSKIQRLLSCLHLSWLLWQVPRGIVYSDFQPLPIGVDLLHHRYQLIHDLRNWTGFGRGGLGRLTQKFQRHQLQSARAVVTVSEFTAQDIVEKCKLKDHEIIVSYNGVGESYKPDRAISNKTTDILYIATFEPRKNHIGLIHALEEINTQERDRPYKVVLLGRDLGNRKTIEHHIQSSRKLAHIDFQIIESLAEEELLQLYQSTRLFVSPSLFEGFGMPLIEAAACGATVACSDIKVFREIMGDGAYYFDPKDSVSMADAIKTAFESANPKHANIERFRWPAITQALFNNMATRTTSSQQIAAN